jgi:translation initiation factor 1 (eIF-1/SUI1)
VSVAAPQEIIITVALEKIKRRTVTVIYNMDLALDPTVHSSEELLSKLKKKICYSNGFIKKPELEPVLELPPVQVQAQVQEESSAESESDSDESENDEETPLAPKQKKEPTTAAAAPTGISYVINGNHSNVICRYIYSLGVKSIIRTGTA